MANYSSYSLSYTTTGVSQKHTVSPAKLRFSDCVNGRSPLKRRLSYDSGNVTGARTPTVHPQKRARISSPRSPADMDLDERMHERIITNSGRRSSLRRSRLQIVRDLKHRVLGRSSARRTPNHNDRRQKVATRRSRCLMSAKGSTRDRFSVFSMKFGLNKESSCRARRHSTGSMNKGMKVKIVLAALRSAEQKRNEMKRNIRSVNVCEMTEMKHNPFERLSDHTIGNIMSFLDFSEVHKLTLTSKILLRFQGHKQLFRTLAAQRWAAFAPTRGSCSNLEDLLDRMDLRFFQYNDWFKHIVIRENVKQSINHIQDIETKIAKLSKMAYMNDNNEVAGILMVESLRWLLHFHKGAFTDGQDTMPVPAMPTRFFKRLFEMIDSGDHLMMELAAKALGVLLKNERNRIVLSTATDSNGRPGLERIYVAAKRCIGIPRVLHALIFSIVIALRPIGGVEGRSFYASHGSHSFRNAEWFAKNGGVNFIIHVILMYQRNPQILEMAFWLVVNLSLTDEVKEEYLSADGLQLALNAMEHHADSPRTVMRAVFSIINICMAAPAKKKFVECDGAKYLISAMRRYPKWTFFIRVGLNVINTLMKDINIGPLATGQFPGRDLVLPYFQRVGMTDLLKDIVESNESIFTGSPDLGQMASEVLQYIVNDGHMNDMWH